MTTTPVTDFMNLTGATEVVVFACDSDTDTAILIERLGKRGTPARVGVGVWTSPRPNNATYHETCLMMDSNDFRDAVEGHGFTEDQQSVLVTDGEIAWLHWLQPGDEHRNEVRGVMTLWQGINTQAEAEAETGGDYTFDLASGTYWIAK